MGRPPFSSEVRRRFWQGVRAGLSLEEAAAGSGASRSWARGVVEEAGGVNPVPVAEPVGRYLSLGEREEIMRLDAAGLGVRAIARALGRDPATVSRDLARGAGRRGYRASAAQAVAEAGRRRPRSARLATNLALRREVQARLGRRDSPRQIAGRLVVDFPDDPEMRVSAETIYQSLYVQARGGLRRELTGHLRTGRSRRKPRRRGGERRGRIPGMVMISERPAEVEDRAVPGHWEGDLMMGSAASSSAVGTLVERATGFVMLLHLPDGHGALAVQEALVAKMATLPEQLRRSLTWDQGREMSNHAQIAAGHRPRHLLLRPALTVAARQQREHQRPAPPILAQGHRPVLPRARHPRQHRRRAQRPTPPAPPLQDPRRSPRPTTLRSHQQPRCCVTT